MQQTQADPLVDALVKDFGGNYVFALDLLEEYRRNPQSVDASWRQYFDRVTGVSDILRGVSDARETLGAQRLKTNAAGTRVDDQRMDVGRFAGDVVRIVAQVMCKHFTSKTLIQSSGILQEEGIGDMMGMLEAP